MKQLSLGLHEFNIGDKVRYHHPNGSIGVVEGIRDNGPFEQDHQFYVRWHYGLNVNGDLMTSSLSLYSSNELTHITDKEYKETACTPGFGSSGRNSDG